MITVTVLTGPRAKKAAFLASSPPFSRRYPVVNPESVHSCKPRQPRSMKPNDCAH